MTDYIPRQFMISPPTEVVKALKQCAEDARENPRTVAVDLLQEALERRGYLSPSEGEGNDRVLATLAR